MARLVPEGRRSVEQVREAVAGLRALQAEIKVRTKGKKGLSLGDLKSAIEEGRH